MHGCRSGGVSCILGRKALTLAENGPRQNLTFEVRWRQPALAIEGLENQDILTNIPTLRKLLDAWLEL